MDELIEMPQIVFVVGGLIAVIAIVFGTVAKIITTSSRERTRREIAAYVAEGSIEPDKAIAMLNAGETVQRTV